MTPIDIQVSRSKVKVKQGSRIPLSRCPGKVKSTFGIVQNKSVLTRRESQQISLFIMFIFE